jgi:hypothetical protein
MLFLVMELPIGGDQANEIYKCVLLYKKHKTKLKLTKLN